MLLNTKFFQEKDLRNYAMYIKFFLFVTATVIHLYSELLHSNDGLVTSTCTIHHDYATFLGKN